MRDWMEYCNYPSGSTLSDERAANGSPEPFNVRYWGVGNELWGCGGNFTAQRTRRRVPPLRHLRARLRRYCGRLPGRLRTQRQRRPWTRGFMDTLAGGPHVDGYSMHFYSNGNLPPLEFTPEAMYTQLNSFPRVEQAIIQQRNLLDGYDPNRRIGLFLDEWGVWDRMIADDERT